MDLTLLIGMAIWGILATLAGYGGRHTSHVILFWKDPKFLMMLIGVTVAVILDTFMVIYIPTLVLTLAGVGMAGYIIGYLVAKPNDKMIIIVYDDKKINSKVCPLIFYSRGGKLYWMPQGLRGILKSGVGMRYPLILPFGEVMRTRTVEVSNGIITIKLTGAVVAFQTPKTVKVGRWRRRKDGMEKAEDGTEISVPRYWLNFTVESLEYAFAAKTIEDPAIYLTQTGVYESSIRAAVEARQDLAKLQILYQSAIYDTAADLVAGLFAMDEDAPGAEEEIAMRLEGVKDDVTA